MFSVKLSMIPEDGALEEKGLTLALKDIELEDPFVGPELKVDFSIRRMEGDQLMAKVKAAATMKLECSRCLKEFEAPAESEFMSLFAKEQVLEDEEAPEDDADSLIVFSGERVPLGEEIRQELALKIPFAPLCSEQCKGLCPVCGVDRNLQVCQCRIETHQKANPFDGLKDFFKQSKEN